MEPDQMAARLAPPDWRTDVLHSEADLAALRPEWQALEQRSAHAHLYVSHDYVRAAWQHLRRPGDRLWIVCVRDAAGALVGLLPLFARTERRWGLRLTVLIHPGILEGERPGVLALHDTAPVWAAAWQALAARRRQWQGLDLRELDEGGWPLTALPAGSRGWRLRRGADTQALYRRAGLALPAMPEVPPGWRWQIVDQPQHMSAAWARYTALEAQMLAGRSAAQCAGTVQACTGADALYQDWLPRLAAQGRAQLALLSDDQGQDQAILLRLLEPRGAADGGAAWLERHAAWRPGPHATTALQALWWQSQSQLQLQLQSPGGTLAGLESQRVHLPEPESGDAGALQQAYQQVRATQQLAVWNLFSIAAPVLLAQGLMARLRRR